MKYFRKIALFTIILFGALLYGSPLYAACDLSNNTGDDYVIICNDSTSNVNITRLRTNARAKVRTNQTVNGGFNTIVAGEDYTGGGGITVQGSTLRVHNEISVGNITINGQVFPF